MFLGVPWRIAGRAKRMSLWEARNARVEMSLPDDCSSFGHQTAQQGQRGPQHLMSEALLFFPTNKNKRNLQKPSRYLSTSWSNFG